MSVPRDRQEKPNARLLLAAGTSSALVVASAMVVSAHLSLRSGTWGLAGEAALDRFHFVNVFLAPVSAGGGVFAGRRFRLLVVGVGFRSSAWRATWGLAAAAAVPPLAAYFLGLLIVFAAGLGSVGKLSLAAGVLAATSQLLAACALGFLVGARSQRFGMEIVVPLLVLVVYVAAYASLPLLLVEVGGSTGNLLGLERRVEVSLAQAMMYGSLAVFALTMACRRPGEVRVLRPARAQLSFAALAVSLLGLWVAGSTRFSPRVIETSCEIGSITLCLAPAYEEHRPGFMAILQPAASSLRSAGLDREFKFTHNYRTQEEGAVVIPVHPWELNVEGVALLPSLFASALLPQGCEALGPAEEVAYLDLIAWVEAAISEAGEVKLADGAVAAWIEVLSECGRT